MNILFISPNSPMDSIGGIERFVANLINYCKNQTSFKIHIILPTSNGNHSQLMGNVTVHYDQSLSLSGNGSTRQKEVSIKVQQFAKNVELIVKTNNINVICGENFHLGVPPAYSILLNMIAGLHNVPLVLRIHSFAVSALQTELINQLMWKKISCVSKSVSGDCFHKGTDINAISTDYLGVDTSEFNTTTTPQFNLKEKLNLSQKTQIILTASRIILGTKNIIKEKGLINLIQAFSKISPRYPDLQLVIAVGKAPERLHHEFTNAYNMLLGYIKLHNIEKNTTVASFQLDEMPSVYKGADLFVLSSENETFGQVFIESMAAGLPVIGTNVGGIPEIISDGYNGYLIAPGDSSILAQRIESLINNATLREKFIEAGRKTVSNNFTSDKQFQNFFAMLQKVSLTS